MKITILGTGTSFGIPMIGCTCPVCQSPDPRDTRLRSSVYLEEGEARFLVDCTPDFRAQALQHAVLQLDAVFITHEHFDHVGGLDELRIYTLRMRRAIDIYTSASVIKDLRQRYEYAFNPPQLGGGIPQFNFIELKEPMVVKGVTVTPIPAMHGKIPILGFRFDRFGYVTDASSLPPESIERLRGVEVLIINALRHQPHITHFSLGQALEIAKSLAPRETYFTHICHRMGHQQTNQMLPPGYKLAQDGLVIEL